MILTLAGIDLGSNAARLLIKKCDTTLPFSTQMGAGDSYFRVPLRTGEDVFKSGQISESKANEIAATMKQFHLIMAAAKVDNYRACATSAFRDAANSPAVLEMEEKVSGLHAEIISGEEEARLVRNSFIAAPGEENDSHAFVDVGGGSTEISVATGSQLHFSRSFQVGSMRGLSLDPEDKAYAELHRQATALYATYGKMNLICTGGNIHMANKLINGEKYSGKPETEDLQKMFGEMVNLSPAEIAATYKVSMDRAEIIVPATLIYLIIAKDLKAERLLTPQVSLRFGIIRQLLDEARKNA